MIKWLQKSKIASVLLLLLRLYLGFGWFMSGIGKFLAVDLTLGAFYKMPFNIQLQASPVSNILFSHHF